MCKSQYSNLFLLLFSCIDHKIVFYMCNSFFFVDNFFCMNFLASTYKQYHEVFLSLSDLTSLHMITSRSTHAIANDILSFLWLSNTPFYVSNTSSLPTEYYLKKKVAV